MGLAQQVQQLFLAAIGGQNTVTTIYPVAAAGVAIKGSGSTTGAFKFAAAGANVAEVVAKNTVGKTWRIGNFGIDTMSALDIIVVRLGKGAAAGQAMSAVLYERKFNEITLAGLEPSADVPWYSTASVPADGATDGCYADLANASAADITAKIHVGITTGFGL